MIPTYQKISYSRHTPYGFTLNHTAGPDAVASTLGYAHHTTEYMLIYFIQGKGVIKVEGRHYDLLPGDVVLLDPTELYHFSVKGGEYHQRIVLHFTQQVLDSFPVHPLSLFAPFSGREKGVGNRIPAQEARELGLHPCLDGLFSLVRSADPADTLLSICRIVELLSLLGRRPIPRPDSVPAPLPPDPLVIRVLDYLNDHFREDLTLEGVAHCFSVSPSHLSHLFREHTGMSLWNYVILRRLHAFNDLLRHTHSIEQSCYQVGFQNYSNFFRLYKKHMSMTPSQYKKQLDLRSVRSPVQFPNYL